MAPLGEDHYCRQFQPNTFDPSRCSACLRPNHMHLNSTPMEYAEAEQPGDLHDWDAAVDDDLSEVTTSASSDDVSGGWTYEWSLVHSLSPERELENCDADIQSRSEDQWGCSGRGRSSSTGKLCPGQTEMTRLDPSPHRDTESSWMDERRGRDRSRRASESRGDRGKESGYFSPERRGDGVPQLDEASKRSYRYYERGHPLPSNYVPEPKACVPYRNVSLGLPSQRRNPETYMQETWRSESPQRYTYHSNFRRGADSQRSSPTRNSSVSPDRYKVHDSPVGPRRGSSLCRTQPRAHASSHSSSQHPSQDPSRHTSGRSSPSRARTESPTRDAHFHRRTDSLLSQSGEYKSRKGHSRESGSPSQASNRHSLDSEKLYRNLESISRRGSSAAKQNSCGGSRASPRTRTALSSREVSPPRNTNGPHGHALQRESDSRDSRPTHSQGSWQGSSHSLLSLPPSHASSSSRRATECGLLGGSPSHAPATEADRAGVESYNVSTDRSRSSVRRGMEALLICEPQKTPEELEEAGMTMEDYILLANIPKIQVELEEEFTGLRWRNQSPSPCRDPRPRTYRYQDETDLHRSRVESEERGRGRERGRDRRERCRDSDSGRLSRRQSSASLHTLASDDQSGKHRAVREKRRAPADCPPTQGWMSKLDERGKWKKHWFVLGDTSLRFYRDSEAEESDDLDGAIDLTSCVRVSDCDVEKNYGLQIQMRDEVVTLSAITSRIRRNWVKLLKQAIQSNKNQSDSGSEKENLLSRRPSPCQPPDRFTCRDEPASSSCTTTIANSNQEGHCQQTLDGDLGADLSPTGEREEGEGWDREQAKRLEERNKWFEEGGPLSEMGSRWDSMELKKGSVPVPVIDALDSEVNRKWTELETLSFSDLSAQSLIGPQDYQLSSLQVSESPASSQTYNSSPGDAEHSIGGAQMCVSDSKEALKHINGAQVIQTPTAEVLHKEAIALRKQVESAKKERVAMGVDVNSPCGPRAPCRAKLEAMEAAHRRALQDLREKHAGEIKELEEERDRMLQEESQAAAKAIEALKAAHREEMKRELEKAKCLCGGAARVDSSYTGHLPQADVLHSKLDVLSERYSQKCQELSRTERSGKSQESELDRKQKELEQLQRENQDLKNKLAEEISRIRYFITGQRLDVDSIGNTGCTSSDLETLLRAKENEVEYLKREISCLQDKVQYLTKEKEEAYKHYQEAYVELSDMRGRSQLELGSLNEHLRLTNAALQEGARHT
ncbi:uncharacterized protein ACNS7B_021632 [Menidia menidia]